MAALITALPIGALADRIGKAKVCYAGGVMMLISTIATMLLVINPFSWDKDILFQQFIVVQMIWGISNGISSGPAQALFADSIEKGGRSQGYMYLQLAYLLPSLLGPIASIILFKVYGDNWTCKYYIVYLLKCSA